MRTVTARTLSALLIIGALALAADLRVDRETLDDKLIEGPYASLLAASTDLGPAREQSIQLTASLTDQSEPQALIDWAREKTLSVQWRPGDDWVVVEGSPNAVERAFDVSVRDYQGRKGQHFYASPHQPSVPEHLRGEVSEIGRILSYTPHHMSRPDHFPLDVPDQGLTPDALLNTYNADDLAPGRNHRCGGHHRDIRLRRFPPIRPGQVHHHFWPAAVHPGSRRWTARRSTRRAVDGSSSGTCHCAQRPQGRRQRPSHRRGWRRIPQDRPDARGHRPPVPRRGMELLHRLGLRQTHHRRRPGSSTVRAAYRPVPRNHRVQRQR